MDGILRAEQNECEWRYCAGNLWQREYILLVEAASPPTVLSLGRTYPSFNCEWLCHFVAIACRAATPLNRLLGS